MDNQVPNTKMLGVAILAIVPGSNIGKRRTMSILVMNSI